MLLGALASTISAAQLPSSYLPPGASGAGGGPGLSTPFRGNGGGGGGGGGFGVGKFGGK